VSKKYGSADPKYLKFHAEYLAKRRILYRALLEAKRSKDGKRILAAQLAMNRHRDAGYWA